MPWSPLAVLSLSSQRFQQCINCCIHGFHTFWSLALTLKRALQAANLPHPHPISHTLASLNHSRDTPTSSLPPPLSSLFLQSSLSPLPLPLLSHPGPSFTPHHPSRPPRHLNRLRREKVDVVPRPPSWRPVFRRRDEPSPTRQTAAHRDPTSMPARAGSAISSRPWCQPAMDPRPPCWTLCAAFLLQPPCP